MSQLFRYLYNCNKRKIAIIYFGFITVSFILLFNMKGVSGVRISGRQDIIIIIFFIVLGINGFAILLTGISSFRKMLKNSMLRYTSISAKKYICANILFCVLLFMILLGIGIIFLYCFSLNIYNGKTNLGIQQAIHSLYNYGILHHILSIFLWGLDFLNMLVSIYFIIVIVKLFNVKSSMNKVACLVLFVIFTAFNGGITYIFQQIEKYVFAINNIGFIDQNGFLNTSFYSGTEVTILNLFFNCLLTIILLVVTGHIIDKKLEV
ncbi:ABC transporter permease [Bacillus sp. 007/AIA-02/001]|uniref:ABC transporter permease n=1 Tax=Bacillus sp. 007/AIA-02/001 TaxID=2509009 RepID=UPI001074BB93|nr:ABC transporter permease [Bacillus sp. 007/AIA-02/001]TFW53083.1 ABC transporter permease [Bacillus sp. 007/AIA-02/001]